MTKEDRVRYAIGALLVVAFYVWVWPGLYEYHVANSDGMPILVKINRITGSARFVRIAPMQ